MVNIDYRFVRDFDWLLFFIPIGLVVFGTIFIHSAEPEQTYWIKQLIWLGASMVVFITMTVTDYRRWLRLAPFFYGFIILCLMAVLVIGMRINGQQCWINLGGFAFQPSEPAKLATILMLARYLSKPRKGPLKIKEMAVA